MSARERFEIDTGVGTLAGHLGGKGSPVLLLHGGPGISFAYLDGLIAELEAEFRVAAFQQRGLDPSTSRGPFTIEQAIKDVVSVLDGLDWQRALVVGHSWGGHLALRFAAAHPDRLLGMLAVDPIGVVGDGGMLAFEAELLARTPAAARARARELDDQALAGEGTPEDSLESLQLVWPSYFGDGDTVPEMPPITVSVEAYSGIINEITTGTDRVAAALGRGEVPYGIIAGGASPIPWGQAARATAELSERAFLEVVPAAGHFIWLEAPGRVRGALRRVADTSPGAMPV